MPLSAAVGWEGTRFRRRAAVPLWRSREQRDRRWWIASDSSWAVWRARAEAIFFNCSTATGWKPPKDSATIGMKAKPSALQSSAAPLILLSYVTEAAWPGVAAAPALVSFLSGWVIVTSRAASLPPHQCRRRISAGLLLLPGSSARSSFRGARPAEAAVSKIASRRALWREMRSHQSHTPYHDL